LFYKSVFQKGAKMKNTIVFVLVSFMFLSMVGCAPLIIGGAVGALGGYAISKDTVQAETDTDYERIWNAAVTVARIRGTVKSEDYARGYLSGDMESSKIWIRLIRLTKSTTRIRISARKYHLPNLSLAQDLFVKVMEQAK
jgi:hypothetical protein